MNENDSERRQALATENRVRKLFFAVWALAVMVVGLFGGLALLIARGTTQLDGVPRDTLLAIGVVSFALVAATLFLSVYATLHVHRVVGAAYHLRRSLEDLATRGAPPTGTSVVELRPDDYLHDVAAQLNRVADRMRQSSSGSGPV